MAIPSGAEVNEVAATDAAILGESYREGQLPASGVVDQCGECRFHSGMCTLVPVQKHVKRVVRPKWKTRLPLKLFHAV